MSVTSFINESSLKDTVLKSDVEKIKAFIVDVSRIVAHMYNGSFHPMHVHICLIAAEMDTAAQGRASAVALHKMIEPLAEEKERGSSFYAIYSAFKAACAIGHEDKNQMVPHAVESVVAAAKAASECRKTTQLIKKCLNNFDVNRKYVITYRGSN